MSHVDSITFDTASGLRDDAASSKERVDHLFAEAGDVDVSAVVLVPAVRIDRIGERIAAQRAIRLTANASRSRTPCALARRYGRPVQRYAHDDRAAATQRRECPAALIGGNQAGEGPLRRDCLPRTYRFGSVAVRTKVEADDTVDFSSARAVSMMTATLDVRRNLRSKCSAETRSIMKSSTTRSNVPRLSTCSASSALPACHNNAIAMGIGRNAGSDARYRPICSLAAVCGRERFPFARRHFALSAGAGG